jgi:hypothetical protein
MRVTVTSFSRALKAGFKAAREYRPSPPPPAAPFVVRGSILLPFRRFTIESPLSPAAARARLSSLVGPKRSFDYVVDSFQSNPPLQGTISDAEPLELVARYRGHVDFARVRIRACLVTTQAGTPLSGVIFFHPLAIGYYLAAAVAMGIGLTLPARQYGLAYARIIVPLAMVAFVWEAVIEGFLIQTKRALRCLSESLV